MIELKSPVNPEEVKKLRAGDAVKITGVIYTGRDAAHKRLCELLELINNTGVGPMGFGGTRTCLAVKVNVHPCHIASLPVAINIQCHSARHKSCTL